MRSPSSPCLARKAASSAGSSPAVDDDSLPGAGGDCDECSTAGWNPCVAIRVASGSVAPAAVGVAALCAAAFSVTADSGWAVAAETRAPALFDTAVTVMVLLLIV